MVRSSTTLACAIVDQETPTPSSFKPRSIAPHLHLLERAILQPHMTQIAFQATVVIGTQLLTSCSQFIQVISRLMHVGTGCDLLT